MLLYRKAVLYFLVFLVFGTLSLGRAFSVFSPFQLLGLPFYITDFFILFSLPLAIKGCLDMSRLSQWFYVPFCSFFFLAAVYLCNGVLIERSPYALRSAVLSVYLLFVPVVWFLFKKCLRPDFLLILLVMANCVSLVLGAGFGPEDWLANTRGFNLTLFYGLTTAFLFPFALECLAGSRFRWLVWGLVALDVFMIINGCVRSSWVALFGLFVLYIIMFHSRKKELLSAFTAIVSVVVVLFLVQGISSRNAQSRLIERAQGTFYFMGRTLESVDRALQIAAEREYKLKPVRSSSDSLVPETGDSVDSQALAGLSETAVNAYSNMTWRLGVWKETWRAGMESPLWGNGFSKLLLYDRSLVTAEVLGPGANSGIVPPHNEFLTVFYRMGLIGVVLFVWINGFVFWSGLRRLPKETEPVFRFCLAGSLGSLLFWHIAAQFFDLIDSPPTNIILWMLLGLVLVLLYGRNIERAKV